jgi:pilus assembly protein Flp/PilA
MKLIIDFWNDEQGVAAAEYALLLTLVSIAVIGSLTALGDELVRIFDYATDELAEIR